MARRKRKKKSDAWLAANPNPKSTPKEIVGKHGHRPHGPSILWPALYEHLRAKGMTKTKAAMISNGMWRKKRGLPPKSVPGTKGKVKIGKAGGLGSFRYQTIAPMDYSKEPIMAEMSSGGKPLNVEAREDAAKEGFALPDGKLPIRNVDELKAAIRLRGTVEGHSATEIRNHIVKRARDLNAVDTLPEAWRPKQGSLGMYRCKTTGKIAAAACPGCPDPAGCAIGTKQGAAGMYRCHTTGKIAAAACAGCPNPAGCAM